MVRICEATTLLGECQRICEWIFSSPFLFEWLLKAVNKFFEQRIVPETKSVNEAETFVYLKSDRRTLKIMLEDIHYIESLNDYVKVHLADRFIITRENISSLEQILPKPHFVRVHRSFIIASSKLDVISEFIEVGKKQIPFGRAFRQSAMAALGI